MLHQTSLGKPTAYIQNYDPELLFSIERSNGRIEQGLTLWPFAGFDLWHAYELSWLNLQGKPCVAIAEFIFPCHSPYLIESKSFKLYLNSFNQTRIESHQALARVLQQDLSLACGSEIEVHLKTLDEVDKDSIQQLSGICLDELPITCDTYHVHPDFLHCDAEHVNQTLYSHLLKSNCPVTNQPDWASLVVHYAGAQINAAGLLRYIVSFRDHQDFHEQCVERIFMDIWQRCRPEHLTVAAYYTRRGGLDINPVRSSHELPAHTMRLWRQ